MDFKKFIKNDENTNNSVSIIGATYHYIDPKILSFELTFVSDSPLPNEFNLHCVLFLSKIGLFGQKRIFTYDSVHRIFIPDSDFGFNAPVRGRTNDGRYRTTCILQLDQNDGQNNIKLGKYESMLGIKGDMLKQPFMCNLPCKITPSKTIW